MRRFDLCSFVLAALSCGLPGSRLTAQQSRNMVLLSKITDPPCETGDVWAMGDYMLLARRWQGFSVIDARNPKNPIVKAVLPPGYPAARGNFGVGDIKADGRYIYATNESSGGGVFIYDAATPMNPKFVSRVTGVGSVHNCWIDAKHNLLYTNLGYVVDVKNKSAPRVITRLPIGFGHDVMVVNNRAYYSLWTSGIGIWDMTNPTAPKLIGRKRYANAATHNMWPTDDGKFLYTTDENVVNGVGGAVRIWDISNLAAITQVGFWKIGPASSVVHNVQVHGDYLFVTYYKEGLRVASIKNPKSPVEIAFFDTYLPTGRGCFGGPFAGAWGVYPWNLDKIFVSDIDSGGYILRLDAVPHTFTAKAAVVPPGGVVELNLQFQNKAQIPLGSFGIVLLSSINSTKQLFVLVNDVRSVKPNQQISHMVRIPVPLGFPRNSTVGFSAFSGLFPPVILNRQTPLTVTIR